MQNVKLTEKQNHTITLTDRKNMNVTGVSEVVNFSDSCVELITSMGTLTVKGKNISISKLNTDTGDLNVNGDIHSIVYTNTKRKTPIFEGLFK